MLCNHLIDDRRLRIYACKIKNIDYKDNTAWDYQSGVPDYSFIVDLHPQLFVCVYIVKSCYM